LTGVPALLVSLRTAQSVTDPGARRHYDRNHTCGSSVRQTGPPDIKDPFVLPFHMKRSYHQPHNWPAEKVAPLVRRLPKTQQTVLGQCKGQTKAHLWSTSFC